MQLVGIARYYWILSKQRNGWNQQQLSKHLGITPQSITKFCSQWKRKLKQLGIHDLQMVDPYNQTPGEVLDLVYRCISSFDHVNEVQAILLKAQNRLDEIESLEY